MCRITGWQGIYFVNLITEILTLRATDHNTRPMELDI